MKPEHKPKEENEMTTNANYKSFQFMANVAAAAVAFAIAAAPGALAAGGSKSPAPIPGTIISHLQLAGGPAARMGLTKKEGKMLLYIEDGSAKVVRVNVTTPEQPESLERAGEAQRVPRLSAAMKLVNSPDIFELLNTIGTNNAQQQHLFSAAASFLADARHSLIFVVDEDGLWIVQAKQSLGDYAAPYDNSDYGTAYGG
jgi:hypothetical protein